MPSFRIVLVEPKFQGNVGSVARVMKNFGQTELALVNPPSLGDEAQGRAMHAWDVVEGALRVDTLEDALRGCDYVVGTSARIPNPEGTYLRVPLDVKDFPQRIADTAGKIAILFGREDFGLINDELEHCDLLVTIPSSPLYRSLNLSQAVGIVLYELHAQLTERAPRPITQMSEEMRRHFHRTFDALIEVMKLPEHQERNTKTAYRKLFGRAVPSAWEYFVMMGVLRRCLQRFGIELPQGRSVPEFELGPESAEELVRLLDAEASGP